MRRRFRRVLAAVCAATCAALGGAEPVRAAPVSLAPLFTFRGPRDPTGARFGINPVGVALAPDGAIFVTQLSGGVLRLRRGPPALLGTFGPDDTGFANARVLIGADGTITGTASPVPFGGTLGRTPIGGTIFAIAPDGAFRIVHRFACQPCNRYEAPSPDGFFPVGDPLRTRDGAMEGVTFNGGPAGFGVLYRLGPDGSYAIRHAFTPAEGAPFGSLTEMPDGSVIGGGVSDAQQAFRFPQRLASSTLYRIAPDGTYTLLHRFDRARREGQVPSGGVGIGPDGALYGLTLRGGRLDRGTFYTLRPDGSGFRTLIDFNGTNGAFPFRQTPLVAPDGRIYGSTLDGGAPGGGDGTLFRYAPGDGAGSGYRLLARFRLGSALFTSVLGGSPLGSLTAAPDGSILGFTTDNGRVPGVAVPPVGVLFRLTPPP